MTQPPPPRIFHITQPAHWQAATDSGSYTQSTRGKTLDEVGFIHCSLEDQIEMVADLVYGDWTGALTLLVIDTALVGSEIRVENLQGGPMQFPHIYGPLPTAAVTSVHQMGLRPSGWVKPDDL
jgi:uncharacterized protein (DUF952 family)